MKRLSGMHEYDAGTGGNPGRRVSTPTKEAVDEPAMTAEDEGAPSRATHSARVAPRAAIRGRRIACTGI